MVGIIASVCGKVKRHRESFLTCREVTAVEGVTFGSGGEPRILAYCPGAQRIHGAVRSAKERGQTGHIVQVFKTFEVLFCIDGLNRYEFRGEPFFTRRGSGALVSESILCNIYFFKIGSH